NPKLRDTPNERVVGNDKASLPSELFEISVMISGSTYFALFDIKKRFLPTTESRADLTNVFPSRRCGSVQPKMSSRSHICDASRTKASPEGAPAPPRWLHKSSEDTCMVLGSPDSVTAVSSTNRFSP